MHRNYLHLSNGRPRISSPNEEYFIPPRPSNVKKKMGRGRPGRGLREEPFQSFRLALPDLDDEPEDFEEDEPDRPEEDDPPDRTEPREDEPLERGAPTERPDEDPVERGAL
jgi:hypothetical protein